MPPQRARLFWPFFLTWMAEQMLVAASHPPLLPRHTHRSSSLQAFFFIWVHGTGSGTVSGCSCARTQPARQRAASKPWMRKATTLDAPRPPPPAALPTRRNPASQPASAVGLHSGAPDVSPAPNQPPHKRERRQGARGVETAAAPRPPPWRGWTARPTGTEGGETGWRGQRRGPRRRVDAGESQCPGQGGAGPGATGADARALHRHQAHPSPSDQELGRPHLRRRGVRAGTIAAPAPSPPRRLRPPVPPPPAPSRPPLLRPAPELCGLLRPLPTDLRRTRSILWGNPGPIPARIK